MSTVTLSEPKSRITGGVMEIPTAHIEPDPDQPRKEFPPEYIEGLGASILAEGLLQPITVRKHPTAAGRYIIIAGECRWRAHCLKEIPAVRCIVSHDHVDVRKRFRAQFLENGNRKNMSIRDEADGIAKMVGWGDSFEVIGAAIGLSPKRAESVYKLTKLSVDAWRLLTSGAINRELAEYAVSKFDTGVAESLLIRGAGKSRSAAAAIIGTYEAEQRQDSLELAFEQAGVTARKASMVKGLTAQLMQAAEAIAKLEPSKHRALARSLGREMSGSFKKTASNRRAARFLSTVFNQAAVALE